MTNQQTNQNIAEALGLTGVPLGLGKFYHEWDNGLSGFEPATDPAAAKWALERYCDKGGHVCTLLYFNESGWIANWTNVDKNMGGQGMGTFCEAICAAIMAAAKGADDEA